MARNDLSRITEKNYQLESQESKWKEDLEKYETEFRKVSRRNEELEEDNGRGNSVYENLRAELRMLFEDNEQLREEKDQNIKKVAELERKCNFITHYNFHL